ncbi:MAG: hypothetical protein LBF40_00710 [Deltaproteobacteria bacterium]|nr:hypothetical protein [Deltaproteobacteria bacterium]
MTFIYEHGPPERRYVYLVEAYRDLSGRPRNRRVRIGRVDPGTGLRVFPDIELGESLGGLRIPEDVRKAVADGLKDLKASHPELLERYDAKSLLGRALMPHGAFHEPWLRELLRHLEAESHGPLILRELIARSTGLGDCLARNFPDIHEGLLAFCASLAFDTCEAQGMASSADGFFGRMLSTGISVPGMLAFPEDFAGRGFRRGECLLAEAQGGALYLLEGKRPWPLWLGMGHWANWATNTHPSRKGLADGRLALLEVVRRSGEGETDGPEPLAPPGGAQAATGDAAYTGAGEAQGLFRHESGLLLTVSRDKAGREIDPLLLDRGARLLAWDRVLSARLAALETGSGRIPRLFRGFLIGVSMVFALSLDHSVALPPDKARMPYVESILREFRRLMRLSLDGKALVTKTSERVLGVLSGLGYTKTKLARLEKGEDPLAAREPCEGD